MARKAWRISSTLSAAIIPGSATPIRLLLKPSLSTVWYWLMMVTSAGRIRVDRNSPRMILRKRNCIRANA